ncbi:MAG TPA: aspartate--tRNA ligase, partial [Planctomycetota bacterium]|nr:aspartate--tRNA ligase [Planctomycetota bacterium]
MASQGLRSHTCGALRASDAGSAAALSGWVNSCRTMGESLVFVDLRDKYGITQVAFDDSVDPALRQGAQGLKPESVIHVRGRVRRRPAGQANAERATGEVELLAESLEVLSAAATPPFELAAADGAGVGDDLRLQYRYLDLRRSRLQRNLKLRHDLLLALRNQLSALGFTEVETPILTKATPEGARDYLVPSRVHPGKFYALPQSPQIFKQILMVAGLDRYFQICRCFRDEDLRADRQPEFTQLDVELSFVDQEQVIETISAAVSQAVGAVCAGRGPSLPFPVMTWAQALEQYGVDKPDLRFGLRLADVTEPLRHCGFGVFSKAAAAGGRVRALAVPEGGSRLSRKEIEQLEGVAREHGGKGLAWFKVAAAAGPGEPGVSAGTGAAALESGSSKFLSADEQRALCAATGAAPGDLILAVADSFKVSAAALGAVRVALGRKLGLLQAGELRFTWVIDFPMFERDEETGALSPAHHPFCMPREQYPGQLEQDPAALPARSYDLVLNGVELGSGSVRIHDSALQHRVFQAIGLPEAEIRERFGFVLDAFRYGAPPHAGFAVGLDRLVMILAGEESIREVIAFPKTATAA